jgi:hypothetical protein
MHIRLERLYGFIQHSRLFLARSQTPRHMMRRFRCALKLGTKARRLEMRLTDGLPQEKEAFEKSSPLPVSAVVPGSAVGWLKRTF